jgi:hypothetical protein
MLASGKRKLESGIIDSNEFEIMLSTAEEFEKSVTKEVAGDHLSPTSNQSTTTTSFDFTTKNRDLTRRHQHSLSTVARTTELWEEDAGAMIYSCCSDRPEFQHDLGASSCMNIGDIDTFLFVTCSIGKIIGYDTTKTTSGGSRGTSTRESSSNSKRSR